MNLTLLRFTAALLLSLAGTNAHELSAASQGTALRSTRVGGTPCDCCPDVCCSTVEQATEERTCWNVRCEKVCVPAVHFPWEPGGSPLTLWSCWRIGKRPIASATCHPDCSDTVVCDNTETCGECCAGGPGKCGYIRAVRVLEQEKYEVTTCNCKWEIKPRPHCCQDACQTQVDTLPMP